MMFLGSDEAAAKGRKNRHHKRDSSEKPITKPWGCQQAG
jgi:hypothetical protein